jgi:ABC-type phosphate/phosphonate transport system substrate-binding protein
MRSASRCPRLQEQAVRMLKRSILAIVAFTLLTATAAQAQQATLVFTAITDEDETRLIERFTQYAKYFESKLGVPVKYLPIKSYPPAATAFANNHVQIARVGYSGDHSRTIKLVQSGAYQVDVPNHLVWEQAVKGGRVDRSAVSIIWETPTSPDYHWVARGDIDTAFGTGFTDRLQAAIMGIDDPKLLAIFDRTKFIPVKNDDYKVIEGVGTLTGLIN